MSVLRRAARFAAEFARWVRLAWEMAVMRDCQENGGHRWGPADPEVCTRCGATESRQSPPPIYAPITTTTGTHCTQYTITYGGESA